MFSLHTLLLYLLLWFFCLLSVLFSDANRHASGETDCCAEILRGLSRLDPSAALLRILIVIVESGGDAQRRAYPSRRRMVTA